MRGLTSIAARITRGSGRQLVQKRGYAADPHGEVKLNAWEAPTQVAKWKEEHIVLTVLAGWGIAIWGAKKAFGGGKKEEPKTA